MSTEAVEAVAMMMAPRVKKASATLRAAFLPNASLRAPPQAEPNAAPKMAALTTKPSTKCSLYVPVCFDKHVLFCRQCKDSSH